MTYRTPTRPDIIPPVLLPESPTKPQVFGLHFAEVTTPDGQPRLPELYGWQVRVWPVARLGDATVEARALYPHLDAAHLREDLELAGVKVLGPIRERR